jgi:hypothetical protein
MEGVKDAFIKSNTLTSWCKTWILLTRKVHKGINDWFLNFLKFKYRIKV